jgi:D-alanine-D-alanine ligase
MKSVLIITGPAGDAQGWGNLEVTQSVCDAIQASGKKARIAFVETMADFTNAIDQGGYDIVWSALYHASARAEFIGLSENDDAWLADVLDARQIPYIGPNAATMKCLIQKYETHRVLNANGVAVPYHHLVASGDPLPDIDYPAFVKPSTESRSVGISDDSVVHTPEELQRQVDWVHDQFQQPALVEAYLPGDEHTVLMLGNDSVQEFLAGTVTVEGVPPGKYPILRSDLRGVGVTKIRKPADPDLIDRANRLCRQATDVLNCYDHVRVDMRVDAHGSLKIIEVNGIPGLKPIKSWSPQMYTLYHGSPKGPEEDYRNLINLIVESALMRYGLNG